MHDLRNDWRCELTGSLKRKNHAPHLLDIEQVESVAGRESRLRYCGRNYFSTLTRDRGVRLGVERVELRIAWVSTMLLVE